MSASYNRKQWIHEGVGLFIWTLAFFYSNALLVILSLIPASFRVIQMWNELNTPMWMEVVVELARVVLFLLILARLEKTEVRQLFHKEFWVGFQSRCVAHFNRNWPHIFIAQMVAFVIFMYGLMNVMINAIVNEWTVQVVMQIAGFEQYDYEAASNAMVFFLKNMSNIPMAMVYIARMCGFGSK